MTVRPLTHPDLLTNLVDFFPSICTIQQSTETQSDTGQINYTWANFAGHINIPCRVNPAGIREPRTPEMTYAGKTVIVLLKGYYPLITELMRAVVGTKNYNILPPEKDGQSITTRLTLELIE